MKAYDLVIIGAGPAGLSAAVYTARANLNTLVIGNPVNSNLYKAHNVQNYLSYEGIPGSRFIGKSLDHVKGLGADFLSEDVVSAKLANSNDHKDEYLFLVRTHTMSEFKCKALIICSGMAYRASGIKGEKALTGKGVHYCVTCDGYFYKSRKLAVVGNMNLAADEALELLTYTDDVTIITNGQKTEFSPELEKALKEKNIPIVNDSIKEFVGETKLEKIKTLDEELNFDGVFMALGTTTALNFASKLGLPLKDNKIVVDSEGRTALKKVYAAGDCKGGTPQAIKSAGEGCVAALSAIKDIKGLANYVDY